MRTAAGVVGLILVVGVSSGCSKEPAPAEPVYPVTGKVLVNGRPAAGARVTFNPAAAGGEVATATAGDDGVFRLSTRMSDDGARAGEYAVTVTWPRPAKHGSDDEGDDQLGGRYATTAKPAARVTIQAAPNELEPFRLK